MDSIPQKPKVDIQEIYRLIDAGHSQGAVSRQLHCTQGYISKVLKARRLQGVPSDLTLVDVPVDTIDLTPTVNGNLPAIPAGHSDASERISALPVHYDASALDDLTSRLATLEAFVAAMQQAQQRIGALPAHSDALERITETLAQLDTRLQAVETAPQLSALPAHQDASAHRSAPERTEPPTWVSRGMHVSTDMLAAIDAYAAKHRLEKRMALDELLRIAFAVVEGQVHDA